MKNEILVIRDGKIIDYERFGKCLGCGECCERFAYGCQMAESPKESKNGKHADLTKHEGWAVEDWDDPNKWRWWGPFDITERKETCGCFDPETKHCEEFGEEGWKEVCRKFPFRPEDLDGLDNCGFFFKETQ